MCVNILEAAFFSLKWKGIACVSHSHECSADYSTQSVCMCVVLVCEPPMVWRLKGMNNWLEKRSSEQEGAVQKEDRVFLGVHPPLSLLFFTPTTTYKINKLRVTYSHFVMLQGPLLSLFTCIVDFFCAFRGVGRIQIQLCPNPFLGHLLLGSLVKMQPRFAAFFNAVLFLSRFSLTTKLFDFPRLF